MELIMIKNYSCDTSVHLMILDTHTNHGTIIEEMPSVLQKLFIQRKGKYILQCLEHF